PDRTWRGDPVPSPFAVSDGAAPHPSRSDSVYLVLFARAAADHRNAGDLRSERDAVCLGPERNRELVSAVARRNSGAVRNSARGLADDPEGTPGKPGAGPNRIRGVTGSGGADIEYRARLREVQGFSSSQLRKILC